VAGVTRMRLLLVEHDVMLGTGIAFALRQDDFVVDWVQDGAAAENALQSGAYSVVILDPGLPRKHSLAFLEALHRRSKAIPVLFIDALVDVDELVRRVRAAARRQADSAEGENTIFALPFSWH
jgi:DNA-binding response OmpR family regulator